MDIQAILTAIGTVGFPITACIAMGWFFSKVNDNYRNDIKELNAAHKDEIKELTSVIQQNTLVIQKLCDSLDQIQKGG
jgi:hypothetical protein